MALTSQQLGLLGLNVRETQVFLAIAAFGPLSVTKIAARSGVRRTSVDYIVRGFVARELVTKVRSGKRFLFTVATEQITQRLEGLETFVAPLVRVNNAHGETVTQSFSSLQDLSSRLFCYFENRAGERVTVLLCQSSADHPLLLESLHKNLYTMRHKVDLLIPRVHVKLPFFDQRGQGTARHAGYAHIIELPAACVSDIPNVIAFHNLLLLVDLNKKKLTECAESQHIELYKYFLKITKHVGWEIDFSSRH